MAIQELYNKFASLHNELLRRLTSRKKVASNLVEKRVPEVVDNLIARRIITPEAKSAMLDNLKDHAKCLLFIDNLSENVKAGSFGRAVKNYTTAGEQSTRESDRMFREILLNSSSNIF